jgi:hypothetical protein
LLNNCLHHGFETWKLALHFYECLTPKNKQIMQLMCNETFKDKDPNEAIKYLELLAKMPKIRTLQTLMRH